MNKTGGMMLLYRDVRAKLVLQAPYGMAPTLSPAESYVVSFCLSMMSIYISLPLHQCQFAKGNGCFSACARCFLSLIFCYRLCSTHSGISFTCSVFLCAVFHSSFICLSDQMFTSFMSSFMLCCRFTLCTWATTTVWLLLWPHGFIYNFCQESLQSNILS